MTMHAHVTAGQMGLDLDIYLYERIGDKTYLYQPTTEIPGAATIVRQIIDEGTQPERPTIQMPSEMGRVLLDALAAHFGGVSEVQTLRVDYLAERSRVDKLIDHLVGARS